MSFQFCTFTNDKVPVKGAIEVARAVEARKAQGSVLEYGLKYHLEGFVRAVIFNCMRLFLM
jgi:hypothetical protein